MPAAGGLRPISATFAIPFPQVLTAASEKDLATPSDARPKKDPERSFG